jgi:uncharacterized cupin superfamily protein
MPRIDPAALTPTKIGSDYPPPYDREPGGRVIRNLSAATGVTDWICNHVTVPPGGWSSQRHWHAGEDELVVVLRGTGVLVDDTGRTRMGAGDVAIFRKDDGNGHHFVNESEGDLVILALSLPEASRVTYPDIDLLWDPERGETHRDGSSY